MCFRSSSDQSQAQSPSTLSGNPAPAPAAQGGPVPAAYATPAAAPSAPLPAPEEPEIGSRRRALVRQQFGSNKPTYRVRKEDGAIGPDGRIQM